MYRRIIDTSVNFQSYVSVYQLQRNPAQSFVEQVAIKKKIVVYAKSGGPTKIFIPAKLGWFSVQLI